MYVVNFTYKHHQSIKLIFLQKVILWNDRYTWIRLWAAIWGSSPKCFILINNAKLRKSNSYHNSFTISIESLLWFLHVHSFFDFLLLVFEFTVLYDLSMDKKICSVYFCCGVFIVTLRPLFSLILDFSLCILLSLLLSFVQW